MEMKLKPENIKRKVKLNESRNRSSSIKDMKVILSDPRFTNINKDPKYRNAPVFEKKIKLDKRFDSVLKNELFSQKGSMDPRGRPRSFGVKENYDKFYEMDANINEKDTNDSNSKKKKCAKKDNSFSSIQKVKNKKANKTKKFENISDIDTSNNLIKLEMESVPESLLHKLLDMNYDVARGDNIFSDDSSDDDSTTTDDDDEDNGREFEWGELDHDAQWDCDGDVEETERFAVCNMDWDQVKAIDLMVLFISFVPPGGKIKKITIYLSKYGQKRLDTEEVEGPQELVKKAKEGDELDWKYLEKVTKGTLDESDRPSSQHIEALRRYQRNRLKYYYAVVECDNVITAKIIYKECDQTPFEVAGVTLDLRYIPSDMEFNDEIVHDCCQNVPENYESEIFQTTALLNSNPSLTWDETDRKRRKTLSSAMSKAIQKQNYDMDKLKDYVASDSGEDEEEETDSDDDDYEGENSIKEAREERIAKFRELMGELENKNINKEEIEIDKEEQFDLAEDEEEVESELKEEIDGLTPFEKYLVKRKEKRKKKQNNKHKRDEEDVPFSDDDLTKALENESLVSSSNHNRLSDEDPDELLDLMLMEEQEDETKHFNMRNIVQSNEKLKKQNKKKRLKKKTENKTQELEKTDDFKINLDDPRFASIASSGDFNIDPSHPQYVPTKAMDCLAKEVRKKRLSNASTNLVHNKRSKLNEDVSNLINKIKLKTKGKSTQ